MTLQDLRSKIDVVDDRLLRLLSDRMGIAREISELKKLEERQIIDSAREKEVLEKIEKKSKKLNLPEKEVREIWQQIFKLSHHIQK